VSSKLAQSTPQEVKLQFHLWRNLCLAETSSTATTMAAPKKETNNHQGYKDAFRADEPGRRKQ
jgi:hypothetical protein